MALFYVTGISGAGKSAVLHELRSRDLAALGVDEDQYANWVNRHTSTIDQLPSNGPNVDMPRWRSDHDWVLDDAKIAKLRQQSDQEQRNVYLCGVASGDKDCWESFNAVFALVIDEDTVRHRISGRRDNSYGKTPEELNEILGWHSSFEHNYRQFGAILIDARQPVSAVATEIVQRAVEIGEPRRPNQTEG